MNLFDSFQCQCRPGYFDKSPDPETKPGRICKECELLSTRFHSPHLPFPFTTVVNECATGGHDCSQFAECVDATDGFACVCPDGFVDISSQDGLLPGRKCSNGNRRRGKEEGGGNALGLGGLKTPRAKLTVRKRNGV